MVLVIFIPWGKASKFLTKTGRFTRVSVFAISRMAGERWSMATVTYSKVNSKWVSPSTAQCSIAVVQSMLAKLPMAYRTVRACYILRAVAKRESLKRVSS